MQILELRRADANTVECVYDDDVEKVTATVNLVVDGDIRGIALTNISPGARKRLYDSPEGLDFARQLRRYFDGAALTMPLQLVRAKAEHA